MQSADRINSTYNSARSKQPVPMKPSASQMKLGLESVKNKRDEVSSFLDESSFIHSYLCGAASSNQPHFHVQPHLVCN